MYAPERFTRENSLAGRQGRGAAVHRSTPKPSRKETCKEALVAGWEEGTENGLVEQVATARRSPGLIVLTAKMQLVFVNALALEVLHRVQISSEHPSGEESRNSKGLVPTFIVEVGKEVLNRPQQRHADVLEPVELERRVCIGNVALLIRAFALQEDRKSADRRAVLLLEELTARKAAVYASTPRGKAFGLTRQEIKVVEGLGRGWTNKEIAQALNLALPTVKEHIRHVMQKTRTTTRTGILTKVFVDPEEPDQSKDLVHGD